MSTDQLTSTSGSRPAPPPAAPPSRWLARVLVLALGSFAMGTDSFVPAGTAIGQHLGWPASLVFVAAVGLAALALLATLPALPAPPAVPAWQRLALLVDRRVLAIVAVTTVATAAGILVYTYIARVLAGTAHVTGTTLAIALLAWGAGGSLGAFGSGWLTDRYGPHRTLLLALTTLGLALLALGHAHRAAAVLPLMAVFGAAGWAVATPNNHRLTGLAPAVPSVVISFNSSGIYLGQAAGAAAGGLFLAHHGTAAGLCAVGAALAAAALGLHLASRRIDHPEPRGRVPGRLR